MSDIYSLSAILKNTKDKLMINSLISLLKTDYMMN